MSERSERTIGHGSERTVGDGSAAVGLVRPDGPAKLTGAARYAADHSAPGLVFAVR
jgi:hypothetical protein